MRALKDSSLTDRQTVNLKKVLDLSAGFHADAGLKSPYNLKVSKETLVIESGHQPNFLPHTGTWKNIFILDRLAKEAVKQGGETVALFGFADVNLSNPALLYRNRIPALTKDGCVGIGFRLKGLDRHKAFHMIRKPSAEEWTREIKNLRKLYPKASESLFNIMDESYRLADNFPDMNS